MAFNCDIKLVTELLGLKPSSTSTYELRFGKKGSLSVSLKNNIWFDHEQHIGGGILDLVIREGKATDRHAAAKYLEEQGVMAKDLSVPRSPPILRAHIYRIIMAAN